MYLCLFGGLSTHSLLAQTTGLPFNSLPLNDLSAFQSPAANWKVVGDVFYDLNKGAAGKTKSGAGIVVNTPSDKDKGHLLTTMEHGDLDLELDFMMDKGSNSGVYLQGRYEIQLFDSWGIKTQKSSDCGAIYERWDESRPEGRKGYEGHPPMQNVSRAPGLWQHLQIAFRAPRFNGKGEKTENARFVKVVLNGVTIHENIEVTGPTRSAAFQDEKPTGPLMIQGDHGPVAVRNIKYKAYGTEPITLSKLKLSAFDGKFKSLADLNTQSPARQLEITTLEHQASGSKDNFGGKITGTIHLPKSGPYLLSLSLGWIPTEGNATNPNGAGELTIGNQKILIMDGKSPNLATAVVNLEAGDHPVELTYYKNFGFWYARSNDITLAVEGPGVAYTTLNAPLTTAEPVGAITLTAASEPVMQRGFINHKNQKKTHTISVGEPGAVNYAVDLQKGELLQVWRGGFLETTPMWHGRGETQLSVPMGSVIEMSGKPSLTLLADKNTAWPDSNANYNYMGYELDKAGRPVFKYTLGGATVRETLEAAGDGKKLSHSFSVNPGSETSAVWCRIAEGSDITQLPNGLYSVNDKQYFIELPEKEKPVIRSTAQNTKELLLPVKTQNNTGTVKYTIVW